MLFIHEPGKERGKVLILKILKLKTSGNQTKHHWNLFAIKNPSTLYKQALGKREKTSEMGFDFVFCFVLFCFLGSDKWAEIVLTSLVSEFEFEIWIMSVNGQCWKSLVPSSVFSPTVRKCIKALWKHWLAKKI